MRKHLFPLVCFALCLLSISIAKAAANSPTDWLERINSLKKQAIYFTEECPSDSVLAYIDRLSPLYKAEKNDYQYFELCRFKVNTLALRGDWITAINEATRLNNEAKERNNPIAIAISSYAIGDTYYHIRMFDKALELYESALRTLEMTNEPVTLTYSLLLQTIRSSLDCQDTKKAGDYVHQLSKLKIAPEEQYPAALHCYLNLALYYAITNNKEKAQECIYKAKKENFADYASENYSRIQCVTGYFHKMFGEYDEALEAYNKALALPAPTGYHALLPLENRAQIYEQTGETLKAFHDYQQAFALKDSVYQQNLIRQMNSLRAENQINRMEFEEESKLSRTFTLLITFIIATLIVAVAGIVHMWRDSKRLRIVNKKKRKAIEEMERFIHNNNLFLTNISQTVNESVTTLNDNFTALQQQTTTSAHNAPLCEKIANKSSWLLKQINDLLNASNVTLEHQKLDFTPENIVSLCLEAVDTTEKSIANCHINFKTKLNISDGRTVRTDRMQLIQILVSLLSMTRRNTSGKEVVFSLDEQSDNKILLSINGTESKIQANNMPDITLTNCLMILQKLNGKLWLEESSYKRIRLYIQLTLYPQSKPA